MGKKKAAPSAVWLIFAQGTLLALGVYLAGILLLALLMVRGTVPEESALPLTAGLCVLSAAGGGGVTARRSKAALPSSVGVALCALAVLALISLLCWQGPALNGRSGLLALCVLAGGLLGGAAGRRGSRRRRKRSL